MTPRPPSAQGGPVAGLLVNLGTPRAPTAAAVRRYLRQFLSDPRVIDLPAGLRHLLVHLVIAPLRAPRSAAAYRRIWTEEGSPLLVHSRRLLAAVRARLGEGFAVELAMRYGEPSLDAAFDRLCEAGVREIRVLPLYPQWAASTSGSVAAKLYELAARRWDPPHVAVLPPFFDDAGFLEATAATIDRVLDAAPVEAVVCSYHGLPERHLHRSAPDHAPCTVNADCCGRIGDHNRRCYRAQCLETTRRLAARLGHRSVRWIDAFQSRMGPDRWVGPSTAEVLDRLAAEGVRHVAVACPSFVADCLETLEEIGIAARERFLAAGGASFHLVPAVNDSPVFADAVARMLAGTTGDRAAGPGGG